MGSDSIALPRRASILSLLFRFPTFFPCPSRARARLRPCRFTPKRKATPANNEQLGALSVIRNGAHISIARDETWHSVGVGLVFPFSCLLVAEKHCISRARTPLVPGNMGVAASDRLGPPCHPRHQTRLNPGNQVVSQPLHSANVDAFLRPRSCSLSIHPFREGGVCSCTDLTHWVLVFDLPCTAASSTIRRGPLPDTHR